MFLLYEQSGVRTNIGITFEPPGSRAFNTTPQNLQSQWSVQKS